MQSNIRHQIICLLTWHSSSVVFTHCYNCFSPLSTYLFRLQNPNRMQRRRTAVQHTQAQLARHLGCGGGCTPQLFLRGPAELLLDLQHQRSQTEFGLDCRVIAHHVHRYVARPLQGRQSVQGGSRFRFALRFGLKITKNLLDTHFRPRRAIVSFSNIYLDLNPNLDNKKDLDVREYLLVFNYFVLVAAALILRLILPVLCSLAVLRVLVVLVGCTSVIRSHAGFCGRFQWNWFLFRRVRLHYHRLNVLRNFLQTWIVHIFTEGA